jgi:glycerol-3-phosphate acyltransferase PlsY
MGKASHSSAQFVDLCGAVGAVCSVIGHSYSIWLGFSGGKGVATLMGALFGINWITALIVCAVWIVAFQTTRYVSLASIAAAVALPVTLAIMLFLKELPTPISLYFSFFLGTIVILRHRSNLSRLLKGTEPRFVRK